MHHALLRSSPTSAAQPGWGSILGCNRPSGSVAGVALLPKMICRIAVLFGIVVLSMTCSRSSPGMPTPPPAAQAVVAIDSMSVAGERASTAGGGFVYRIVMYLRETGGRARDGH